MTPPAPERPPASLGARIVVGLVAVALAAACVMLGSWQWTRAHVRAEAGPDVESTAPVPIADVLAPASASESALGTTVSVVGEFGPGVAVIGGREVDGAPADLLVREFTVAAEATGTGQPATLSVLVGSAPTGTAPGAAPAGEVELVGYLRVAEPPPAASSTSVTGDRIDTTALSPALFAQHWPAPLYSAVLVADAGQPGWEPLPAPAHGGGLNLQSATYAAEWWLFGAFAVFVAARWIRDSRLKREPT